MVVLLFSQVQQAPTLDYVTLQRIFRALQSWLKSHSCHKMLQGGIVPALAKVCDSLLLADYSKSDIATSLLDLLFLVEDISEVPSGRISFFECSYLYDSTHEKHSWHYFAVGSCHGQFLFGSQKLDVLMFEQERTFVGSTSYHASWTWH